MSRNRKRAPIGICSTLAEAEQMPVGESRQFSNAAKGQHISPLAVIQLRSIADTGFSR